MALFKISKGDSQNLGVTNNTNKAVEGWAYFTPDDGKFYIDIDSSNTAIMGVNRIPLNAARSDKLCIKSKTYNKVTTTANTDPTAWLYFAMIHPDNFDDIWHVRYRLFVQINNTAYYSWHEVDVYGHKNTYRAYRTWNAHSKDDNDTWQYTLYDHIFYWPTLTGFTNGYGALAGIRLQSSALVPTSSTNTTNWRIVNIDIIEEEHCSVEWLSNGDNMVLFANVPGTGSTNYTSRTSFDGRTQGMTMSGDRNTVDQLIGADGVNCQAATTESGGIGLHRYGLQMMTSDGKWSSIAASTSAINTGQNVNDQGINKQVATAKFLIGSPLLYMSSNSTILPGNSGFTTRYTSINFDGRYTFPTTVAYAKNVPIYLVGNVQNDGTFQIAANNWWTQDLPTEIDNKDYLYVGIPRNSDYYIQLSPYHPIYRFRDEHIVVYNDFAQNAQYATNANHANTATTASWAITANSARHAASAGFATTARWAVTASRALRAANANYSSTAYRAVLAGTATFAISSGSADYAANANAANSATTASYAQNAAWLAPTSNCADFTIRTTGGLWNHNHNGIGVPITTAVWSQAWIPANKYYYNTTAAATAALTDFGSMLLWLSAATAQNTAYINMCLDGRIQAQSGFIGDLIGKAGSANYAANANCASRATYAASANYAANANAANSATTASNAVTAGNAINAKIADYPAGFSSKTSSATWGNTTGTFVTGWKVGNASEIAFFQDNPDTGNLSIKLDGTIYIKEGNVDIGDAVKSFSVNGQTVTYTTLWGNTGTFATKDTTYPIQGSVQIESGFENNFRTQTKGNTNNGWYISTIRAQTASLAIAPRYGSGLAWGANDTHGYLYCAHSTLKAFIGGGSGNELSWTAKLALLSTTASIVSGRVIISEGTDGQIKSSDYTIAKSVPSDAVFTDTKVSQNNTTTTSWRKMVLGYGTYSNSNDGVASVTNNVCIAQNISAQPSTGTIRANVYRVQDNIELQWNDTDESLDFIFI